jgi:hypothetical protein
MPPPVSATSRFVGLHHRLSAESPRATHWDFMIEVDGVLRTWALEREPAAVATIPALALADHRLAYLEYEGPVSGDRGEVSRWDRGTYRRLHTTGGELLLELSGDRLRGQVTLTRDPASEDRPDHWTVRFSSGNVATPV